MAGCSRLNGHAGGRARRIPAGPRSSSSSEPAVGDRRERHSHTTTGEPPTTRCAAPSPAGPSRRERDPHFAARSPRRAGRPALVTVSLLANFVRREALAPRPFRDPSQQLIANEDIRNQARGRQVDQLYAGTSAPWRACSSSGCRTTSRPWRRRLQASAGRDRPRRAGAARAAARPTPVRRRVVACPASRFGACWRTTRRDSRRATAAASVSSHTSVPSSSSSGDRFGFLGNLDQTLPPDAAQITCSGRTTSRLRRASRRAPGRRELDLDPRDPLLGDRPLARADPLAARCARSGSGSSLPASPCS